MPRKKSSKTSMTDRGSRATIIDVAKRAGVHWSTVSRALNPEKQHLISPEMIERVSACVRELGYRANALASGLRTQRSRTIGVIVSNLGDPVHPPIVRAIEDRFAEIGYVTLVGNSDNYPERQAALIDRFIGQGVDGLIVATFFRNDPIIATCLDAGIPTVAVFRDPEHELVPSVRVDDAKAMEIAVHHLAELGHRHIAHIAGPQNVSTGYYRCRGFRRACRSLAKLGVTPAIAYGKEFTIEDGEIACRTLLNEHKGITAIVAANDMLAVGALRQLEAHGIRCPADISIVGMNDMAFMDSISPALTTVRTPTADLGKHAAEILVAMIHGTSIDNRRVVLNPALVIRNSVTSIDQAKAGSLKPQRHAASAPDHATRDAESSRYPSSAVR
jgi:LacI family transcriptional regulator